jgi:hypothetical protein
MDRRDFAIGVLSTTACILLVGIVIINTRPETAAASGMTTAGGDYLIAVGAVNQTEDLMYVIDAAAERMIAYSFDSGRRTAVMVHGVDLKQMRAAAAGQPQPQTQPQPPRGRGNPRRP